MQEFDFHLRTRMVCGSDAIDRLGRTGRRIGDAAGIGRLRSRNRRGRTCRAGLTALRNANIETYLFGEAHENPTTDDIENGLAHGQAG